MVLAQIWKYDSATQDWTIDIGLGWLNSKFEDLVDEYVDNSDNLTYAIYLYPDHPEGVVDASDLEMLDELVVHTDDELKFTKLATVDR